MKDLKIELALARACICLCNTDQGPKTGKGSQLSIRNVRATDSGQYVCTTSNSVGKDRTFMWLTVIGPPGEPGKPLGKVMENTIELQWNPSGTFGNASKVWYCVLYRTRKKKGFRVAVESVDKCFVVIEGLTPGRRYQFQIKAFNECCTSLPSASSDVIKLALKDVNITENSSAESCQEDDVIASNSCSTWRCDFYQQFEVDREPIGRGRFSLVKKAECIRTGNIYAVKCCSRYDPLCLKGKLESEFDLLNRLHHPNVVKVFSLFETKHDFIMLAQWIPGPPIIDFITHLGYYNELLLQTTMNQLLGALNYLHNLKIGHFDVKPENVLINPKIEPFRIVLIDFGEANMEGCTTKTDVAQILGSIEFSAPEQLQRKRNLKSDIWASGAFLYVFLSGISPFLEETDEETQKNILKGNFTFPDDIFGEVPSMAVNLVAEMLTVELRDRPSSAECLEHRWFKMSPHEVKWPTQHLINYLDRRKFAIMKMNQNVPI